MKYLALTLILIVLVILLGVVSQITGRTEISPFPTPPNTPPFIEHPPTTSPPTSQKINIFFPNLAKFNVGKEPYENTVERTIGITKDPKQAVLEEIFKGPTPAEKAAGLFMTYNEATSATLTFEAKTGVAKVYLLGGCNSGGATYTIGSIIAKNLRQFKDVKYVRIYDPEGKTANPETPLSSSSPFCLEP